MLLKRTFNRDSSDTMLPNAFVRQTDSLDFLHFVLGLLRSFLWLSIFVKLHILIITNCYVFLLLRYFLFDTKFLYDIDMIICIYICIYIYIY